MNAEETDHGFIYPMFGAVSDLHVWDNVLREGLVIFASVIVQAQSRERVSISCTDLNSDMHGPFYGCLCPLQNSQEF